MPEGHTLHRLARTLDRAFGGTTTHVTSPQGRFSESAAHLDGGRIEGARAWGKHLFVDFADDRILGIHLGLIGVFDVRPYAGGPGHEPPPVGAVRVRLRNATHVADLRGATVVDLISPEQVNAILARLGPDPLRVGTEGNEPSRTLARLARSGRPIAELLMDQSILAGVGNVYRCEVLFRHRVDPMRPGNEVRPRTFLAIWDDLVTLMPIGVAFGQIITLEAQLEQARKLLANAGEAAYDVGWQGAWEGERGRRPAYESASPIPREYAVYKRTGLPCRTCGTRIRARDLAGRTLYWCGRCQRRR